MARDLRSREAARSDVSPRWGQRPSHGGDRRRTGADNLTPQAGTPVPPTPSKSLAGIHRSETMRTMDDRELLPACAKQRSEAALHRTGLAFTVLTRQRPTRNGW